MGPSVTGGNEDLSTSILEPLFTFDGDDDDDYWKPKRSLAVGA